MLKPETLYSLSDITIIPSKTSRIRSRQECCPECLSLTGRGCYLPVVTAPMDSVVGEENYKDFMGAGISPIIPRTTPLETRLSLSAEIFCAYGLAEVEECFLKNDPGYPEFYVLVDIANGHLQAQLDLGRSLKSKYGGRLKLMGGNIANPETILEYWKAGFDYVRVGIGGGHGCITSTQCGVHYPMASLLSDIREILNEGYCPAPKIIADGGIRDYSEAIKCLALGADYVMMGYTLSKALEASGNLYANSGKLLGDREEARMYLEAGQTIFKEYHGMSTKTAQAKILGVDLKESRGTLKTSEGRVLQVQVEYTLQGWTDNFRAYLRSAMSYVGVRDLPDFRTGTICKLLSPSARDSLKK